MEDKQAQRVPRDIEHYFGFLYDRGYRLRQVEHAEWLTGNWQVIFESSAMLVFIGNNDGRITLELSANSPRASNRRFPIERLINMLSDEQDIVVPFRNSMVGGKKKQMERLSALLRAHIDHISSYFQSL